jgi:hypothetical protein
MRHSPFDIVVFALIAVAVIGISTWTTPTVQFPAAVVKLEPANLKTARIQPNIPTALSSLGKH